MKAVDLFCGAGGSSIGAEQSGRVIVVAAVNHWQRAVETHAANHPHTRHFCQDAALLDPAKLPAHDLLLASPECRGHCRARGKEQVRHDKSRATAWCVVNVAEITQPRAIVVENVPEFLCWTLFPHWSSALEALGYFLSWSILDSADFGIPQHRERLYVFATKQKRPVVIDAPGKRVPIRDVIDLSLGSWSPIADHCAKTVRRARNGRDRFGDFFVMPYYGSGSGETGRSVDRPIGTVTTRDRWAIVNGDNMRMFTVREYQRAMGFPDSYQLTGTRQEQIWQLGNAVVPPVMSAICAAL